MKQWIHDLIEHHQKIQSETKKDLLILFDIDGTVLDLRFTLFHLLKDFDLAHRTSYFENLCIQDILSYDDDVQAISRKFNISNDNHLYALTSWYFAKRWSSHTVLRNLQSVPETFELIRWFQSQPRTRVGLNSGRSEVLRVETLLSLNAVGKPYGVEFDDSLLYMNKAHWPINIPDSKIAGIKHFHELGYKVFCMVDNERENLSSISQQLGNHDVLLLLAGMNEHQNDWKIFEPNDDEDEFSDHDLDSGDLWAA